MSCCQGCASHRAAPRGKYAARVSFRLSHLPDVIFTFSHFFRHSGWTNRRLPTQPHGSTRGLAGEPPAIWQMRHKSPSSSESSSRRLSGKQALVTRSLHVCSFHKYQFPERRVGRGGKGNHHTRPRPRHPHAYLGANSLLPLTLLKILPGKMVTDNRVRDSFSFSFFLGRSRQVVEVFKIFFLISFFF